MNKFLFDKLRIQLKLVSIEGTNFFHIVNDEIFSNSSLDRESLEFPGGPGPHVHVRVRCVVWEENTGNQHVVESNLYVDILDEDDNPPIAQTNSSVQINLRDFTEVKITWDTWENFS